MRTKVKSPPEGRAVYRRRGGEIEPRFGWKKRITLPQFRLRGLLGASAEVALSCIANNLRQIANQQNRWQPA